MPNQQTTINPDLDSLDSELIQRLNKTRRLGGVEYYVAVSSSDYKQCHMLARAEGIESKSLTYPTIMAKKDGQLIGFVSTYTVDDMVAMGPLVLKSDRPHPMIALRLIEAFDTVMQGIGIEWYIFYVGVDSNLKSIADRLGMTMYAAQHGKAYYLRELSDGRNRDRSTEAGEGGD